MPAASWRTSPARTMSLWLMASASAGSSRSVGMRERVQRMGSRKLGGGLRPPSETSPRRSASRRASRGWGPAARGEQSENCAGEAGARSGPFQLAKTWEYFELLGGGVAAQQPGHLGGAPRLVGLDGLRVLLGQSDLVLSLEERLLPERVHIEAMRGAVGRRHCLALEIHAHVGARVIMELTPETSGRLGRDDDGEHTVLEAVLHEDIAEGRPDHASDPVMHERPHRTFPRGAAAEVVRGDEDLRLPERRLVEDEISVLGAVGIEADVVEEELPVARLPRLAEEARGDDAVGIDVGKIHGHGRGGESGEWLHDPTP